MKLILTCLTVALALAPNLMAQSQVNYSAPPGMPAVYTLGGAPVANGNSVWIGAFNPTFNVTANANRPDLLLANWHSFGSTTITTIGGQPGRFTKSDSSTDPFFGNQKIYIWIFSTFDASAPNTVDFSDVDEYGLFSSTQNSSALTTWIFSPDPPPNNLRTINSSQVDQLPFGSRDATHLFLSPGFVSVPEPSTLALLSLAIPAAALALRRRR